MNKYHMIKDVVFINGKMVLTIDGKQYEFSLADISTRLAAASSEQRQAFQISPSGYGIYWPLVDEDLSIDGLLQLKSKSGYRTKSSTHHN